MGYWEDGSGYHLPYFTVGSFLASQTISLNGGFAFGIDWYILPGTGGTFCGLSSDCYTNHLVSVRTSFGLWWRQCSSDLVDDQG